MQKEDSPGLRQTGWGEQSDDFCHAMVGCLARNRNTYLVSVDSSGYIIWCNHATADLLGLSSDEFSDKRIWEALTESDGERLRERLSQPQPGTDSLLLNFVTPAQLPTTLDCDVAPLTGEIS